MPLIADNVVVFLFRLFRRWFLEFRCRNWILIEGAIAQTRADYGMYPYVEIGYKFKLEGSTYTGSYLHGFWDSDTARAFRSSHRGKSPIKIRYCPGQPAKSYMREKDRTARTNESQAR
jgi:hypothetical protein